MAAWTGRRRALRRRRQSTVPQMITSKWRTRFPTGLGNVASQLVTEEPNVPCCIETSFVRVGREKTRLKKRFSQALEAKGYIKDPKARHATFLGIALEMPASWTEASHERA